MAGPDRGPQAAGQLTIVAQTRPQDRLPDIAYVFAPLKHARLDYMVQKAVEMGAARLQPVLTRFTQVSRVNGERMRANVIEAAEQCGILSLAEVADPMPLDRFVSQRQPARLLVFCDEAAEIASPIQALQRADRRRRHRHPDRPRRRICRGRARAAAAPAQNLAAVPRAPESCGRIPQASPRWRWCRPHSATGPGRASQASPSR